MLKKIIVVFFMSLLFTGCATLERSFWMFNPNYTSVSDARFFALDPPYYSTTKGKPNLCLFGDGRIGYLGATKCFDKEFKVYSYGMANTRATYLSQRPMLHVVHGVYTVAVLSEGMFDLLDDEDHEATVDAIFLSMKNLQACSHTVYVTSVLGVRSGVEFTVREAAFYNAQVPHLNSDIKKLAKSLGVIYVDLSSLGDSKSVMLEKYASSEGLYFNAEGLKAFYNILNEEFKKIGF